MNYSLYFILYLLSSITPILNSKFTDPYTLSPIHAPLVFPFSNSLHAIPNQLSHIPHTLFFFVCCLFLYFAFSHTILYYLSLSYALSTLPNILYRLCAFFHPVSHINYLNFFMQYAIFSLLISPILYSLYSISNTLSYMRISLFLTLQFSSHIQYPLLTLPCSPSEIFYPIWLFLIIFL